MGQRPMNANKPIFQSPEGAQAKDTVFLLPYRYILQQLLVNTILNPNVMPQSLSRVYVHFTYSTKEHYSFLDIGIRPRVFEYLGGICKGLECHPVIIGGHIDHVHILCLLSRKTSQMKLVEELKKQSSQWVKKVDSKYSKFSWQRGYGVFSVNPKEVDVVKRYIENQDEHHKKMTFKEEFRLFLKNYNVDYDERYVWD
jgi:putative transposase